MSDSEAMTPDPAHENAPNWFEFYNKFSFFATPAEAMLVDDERAIVAVLRSPNYDDSMQLASDVAARLIQQWPEPESPKALMTTAAETSLGLSRTLERLRLQAAGVRGGLVGLNSLANHAIGFLAFEAAHRLFAFPRDNVTSQIWTWLSVNKSIASTESAHTAAAYWTYRLAGEVNQYYSLQSSFFAHRDIRREEVQPDVTDLEQANAALWHELVAKRTYALKPAIAPSLGQGLAVEWLFETVNGVRDYMGDYHFGVAFGRDIRALVTAAQVRFSGTSLEYSPQSADQGRELQTNIYDLIESTSPEEAGLFPFFINKSGDLLGPTGQPLRTMCEAYGFGAECEQMRSEVLTIFFDMVTPQYVEALVKQEESSLAKAGQIDNEDPSLQNWLKRLTLARTRVLQTQGDKIGEAIREEVNAAQILERARKSPAHHSVTGYVMKIRPHFRASEKQRQLCRENLGIELAEFGETYVHTHVRGSRLPAEKPKGHRASYKLGKAVSATTERDPNSPIKPKPRKQKGKKGKK